MIGPCVFWQFMSEHKRIGLVRAPQQLITIKREEHVRAG
jgi:hypothetical protein